MPLDFNKNPGELRRLWGRSKGRPLSVFQQSLVDTRLADFAVGDDPLAGADMYEAVRLEVGFGGAEHLLARAKEYPNTLFIGIEPFLNGVAKALAGIEKDKLTNIRLHHGDARDIFDLLPDNCVDHMDILYPDPWPKPRHFKRRLVNEAFIKEISRIVKPGGKWCFASDICSYVDWALLRVNASGLFSWRAKQKADWLTPYDGWPSTRYEAKALREGRTPHYFTFINNS